MYRPPVIDWDILQEDVPNPFFQVISPAKFEENFQKQLTYEEAGSVCMESTYYTKHTKKEEKTLKVYSKVWSDHIFSEIVYLVFQMLFLFMFKFSLFLIVYSASICPYCVRIAIQYLKYMYIPLLKDNTFSIQTPFTITCIFISNYNILHVCR